MVDNNGECLRSDIEELIKSGQSVQFPIRGYSMYPLLDPGKHDQVIVIPLDGAKRLRRGDVALYRRDGEKGSTDEEGFARGILVLHRVIRRKGDEVYFVGDNQNQVEGPLRMAQVLGIMSARVRGKKLMSVKNPLYVISAGMWLLVCPIRPKIMRAAEIIKSIVMKKE